MALRRAGSSALDEPVGAPPAASLFGRRDLLSRGGLLALAAATLGGIGVGLRSLWPRQGRAAALAWPAGRPEEYRVGQVSDRLLKDAQIFVVRTAQGFLAYSAACTHLGCRLHAETGQGGFRCRCHGSLFSAEGEVLRGPAARPMERVAIRLAADGTLRVDPAVRYRKERGEWVLPGAFVAYRGPQGGHQ